MSRLLAALLILPYAALAASAQVRVGAAAEAPAVRALPAAGVPGGVSAPLSVPSAALSLSPSLPAPSVSPRVSAPVLPASVVAAASVRAAAPAALAAAATPAASKAGDLRAEAARTVADWKASRAAAESAAAPAPSVAPGRDAVPDLDALFDGTIPASDAVLARAAALGLDSAGVGDALAKSRSVADAAARLESLGVLGKGEAALAGPREEEFRFLLVRLWRKTSAFTPSPFGLDRAGRVPALTVERGGVTYFVHAVTHGQYGPPRRGAVLSLARRLAAAGKALYSEQNLPLYYGFNTGYETLDHASETGAPAEVVSAARGYTRTALLAKRLIDWAVAPGSALAALAWVIVSPSSLLAWFFLPVLGLLAWLVATGALPLMRARRRRLAAAARAEGLTDMAEQYADEAENFFTAKPDLAVLRGLELPQPLGASADPLSVRSRAIADAVSVHAAAAGVAEAHLIVGHLHAHEVAARLAEGPRPSGAESQIS